MHLYFHTNTEMALYYIKELLRDGDEDVYKRQELKLLCKARMQGTKEPQQRTVSR